MPELPRSKPRCAASPRTCSGNALPVWRSPPAPALAYSKKSAQAAGGQNIRAISRRAKYLLVDCGSGTLILHLA